MNTAQPSTIRRSSYAYTKTRTFSEAEHIVNTGRPYKWSNRRINLSQTMALSCRIRYALYINILQFSTPFRRTREHHFVHEAELRSV